MNKDSILTQESFDALLAWLDPDRERAGWRYEEIRRRLVKLFTCRGCGEPEALADETIDRVVKRLKEIEASYTGDRALYFYGVANKVYLEYLRRRTPAPPPPPAPSDDVDDEAEREYACLDRCMERLPDANRELILRYYEEEKGAKIDQRRRLAENLGIALNALRIRAHRIRAVLQECVEDCLEGQAAV
jgi:DNA-directed RNA polymerase specialized sigma24 family protein